MVFGRPSGTDNATIYQVDLDGSNEQLLYEEPETHIEGVARLIADDVVAGRARRDRWWRPRDRPRRPDDGCRDSADGLIETARRVFFAPSPDGARVAYQSEGPEPGLLVMEADGTNSRHVTSEYSGGWIAWTADGSTLSFVSGGWINLIRPDGTGLTRLLQGDSPSWRPAP